MKDPSRVPSLTMRAWDGENDPSSPRPINGRSFVPTTRQPARAGVGEAPQNPRRRFVTPFHDTTLGHPPSPPGSRFPPPSSLGQRSLDPTTAEADQPHADPPPPDHPSLEMPAPPVVPSRTGRHARLPAPIGWEGRDLGLVQRAQVPARPWESPDARIIGCDSRERAAPTPRNDGHVQLDRGHVEAGSTIANDGMPLNLGCGCGGTRGR